MLLHCNNYAFAKTQKTPSYPPWGKIDYALRLRFFLSFILAFLSFFLSSSREVSVSGLPLTGGREGVFLSFYLYISLFI